MKFIFIHNMHIIPIIILYIWYTILFYISINNLAVAELSTSGLWMSVCKVLEKLSTPRHRHWYTLYIYLKVYDVGVICSPIVVFINLIMFHYKFITPISLYYHWMHPLNAWIVFICTYIMKQLLWNYFKSV